MTDYYDAHVCRGIAFLDANYNGDWRSKIDLGKLDLSYVDKCILGQLHGGSYFTGRNNLDLTDEECERNGFTLSDNETSEANWVSLTQSWVKYLTGTATADVYSVVSAAEQIVSVLDGLTLKQLRKNKKLIKKLALALDKDLKR